MQSGKAKGKEKREEPGAKSATRENGIHLPILRILRFLIQLLSFVLLYAGLFQLTSFAFPIPVVPVLSSSGAPGATAISALDALEHGLSAVIPLLLGVAVAVFLLSAVLVGRGFCAFVCPFGFAQDLVSFIRRPFHMKETTFSVKTTKSITSFKYYIVAVLLLLVGIAGITTLIAGRAYALRMLGIFSDVPFSTLSPADTLFATLPELAILGGPWVMGWGAILWSRVIILVISLGAALFIPRAFCRYICPIAGLMAPLNRYTVIGLERNPVKCIGEKCRICERACPMDVPIFSGPDKRFTKHPECIMCLVCKDVCHNKAIRFAVA
ncbi:MAG: 4Fe-4S binding protein [Promethearchaeati archaeon SRVP18_Atabeyarchaeia-1]